MTPQDLNWAAGELLAAQSHLKAREPLANRFPEITLDEGYAIQFLGRRLREEKGEKLSGWKMGLTSKAKREQMGLHSSIFGYLFQSKAIQNGIVPVKELIHPKIECEIAFKMKAPLHGKVSHEEAFAAVDVVAPAFEIIDSRYVGFKYFSLPDVVADNCSSGLYMFGESQRISSLKELDNLPMVLECNGERILTANSNDISGHPIQSLCELSQLLASHHGSLKAGDWVLAGSAGQAFELKPGQSYRLSVQGMCPLEAKSF